MKNEIFRLLKRGGIKGITFKMAKDKLGASIDFLKKIGCPTDDFCKLNEQSIEMIKNLSIQNDQKCKKCHILDIYGTRFLKIVSILSLIITDS